MKKKIAKKWILLSLILAFLLPIQFLNQTGFCYEEMKYLGEQDIIDRFLFNENQVNASYQDKVALLKKKSGAKYPECCELSKKPMWLDDWEQYFNALWGHYLFGISYLYPEKSENNRKTIYVERFYAVNACGHYKDTEAAIKIEEKGVLMRRAHLTDKNEGK